jgi:hypothetical protein
MNDITLRIFTGIIAETTDYNTNLPKVGAGSTQLHDVLQIVFAILGALALLMIVIGGFRYIVSQGSPQEVSKAKSTVIYALIGILVAGSAEAIVTLALGRL